MALLILSVNICRGLAFVDFQGTYTISNVMLRMGRFKTLLLKQKKKKNKDFRNLLEYEHIPCFFIKCKPVSPARKELSSFEIWMCIHFSYSSHAIICPSRPLKESVVYLKGCHWFQWSQGKTRAKLFLKIINLFSIYCRHYEESRLHDRKLLILPSPLYL